ncbi:17-beta-hydroxysteroid dehydrogenase type 6-like [Aquarana catesbeiana]|uniref:17-beta-hydroxysteroid dehydrogenase type 6-like n=1 Tax=Aquarana catesbeiana TaxID=8400 RepID=UPI003CC9CC50
MCIMWLPLLVALGLILLYRWYRQSQILENLTDKYVFITGCDSGFGNLLAKQLDKRGMKVLASCLTETGAENLKTETSSRLRTRMREMRDFGVKVSIIEPGAFKTPACMVVDNYINNLNRMWEKLPAHIKESYGEDYLKQCIKALEAIPLIASPKTYKVPDCMEHALTAVHPWTRYSPGWDCKLYYLPLSYLPTAITDYWLGRSAPKPASRTSVDEKNKSD